MNWKVYNRTDFDLSMHARHSGVDLSFYDQINDVRYTPYVNIWQLA